MFFARHIFNESHGATQFPIGSLPYWAIELDYCSESDAQRVAQYADLWKISFCPVAIAENVLNCEQVTALYSLSEDCDEVDLDEDPVDPALIPLLPAAEARAYRLIPWRKCGKHIYYVTDSPHLFAQLYRQKSYFRAHAKIVLTHPDAWQEALARHHGCACRRCNDQFRPYTHGLDRARVNRDAGHAIPQTVGPLCARTHLAQGHRPLTPEEKMR